MAQFIVILSQHRSGSNYLSDILRANFDIRSMFELYNNNSDLSNLDTLSTSERVELKKILINENASDNELSKYIEDNPEQLFDAIDKLVTGVISFKILATHLLNGRLDWVFTKPNCNFILLTRTSTIEMFISLQLALMQDKWESTDTSDKKISIDPVNFIKFKHNTTYCNNLFRYHIHKKEYLPLVYEELSSSKDAIKKWANKLNIMLPEKTRPESLFFKKQQKSLPSDIIINYSDIVKYIDNF
jgi:hypothetical protein